MDTLENSVAFTGHRTCRMEACGSLREVIEGLYARGMRTFLSGMAVGFDLAAAEAVVACRADTSPGLRLVAVVPFAGQPARFGAYDRIRYERLLAAADKVVVLSDSYHRGCYAARNDYLTNHASVIVAWYDGSPGGTQYTVRRAVALGREVRNLHPSARAVANLLQTKLF